MAQTIKLKRSATPGAIPSLESLELGEIAINTNDGKVYIKKDDGTSPDTIIEVTGAGGLASGDLNFLDNEKAIFGDGSDLQIYHDGISSYIKDSGTGRLTIQSASDFLVANTANTQNYIYAVESGAVNLYHSGSRKFETTATGIDVTGSVTATRLITSDGIGDAGSAGSESVFNSGQTTANFRVATTGSANTLFIDGGTNKVGIGTTAPAYLLHLEDSNGADLALGNSTVSPSAGDYLGRIYALNSSNNFFAGINMFYHDADDGEIRFRVKTAGTNTDIMTLVDGSVGIGTSSPSSLYAGANNLVVGGGTAESGMTIYSDSTTGNLYFADGTAGAEPYAGYIEYNHASDFLRVGTGGAEVMRIDSSGNVGINQTDPQTKTHITAAGGGSGVTDVLTIQTTRNDVGTAFAGGAINFVNNDTNSAGQARIKVGSSNNVATIGLNSESAQSFIFETSTSGSATTSNIDGNATTITVTHETYAGFVPGQRISINTGTYQGGYFIDTVTSDTEFTIADTDHDLVADSSGTPTIQYAVPRDSMIIRADGNVGIGTNVPEKRLHVHSGIVSDIVKFENDAGSFILGKTASLGSLDMASDANFRIRHGSIVSATFSSNGRVGIGTSSPGFKLHVSDNSNGDGATGGILVENTGTTTGEANLAFKNQDTGSNYWFTGLNQDTNYALNYGTTFGDPGNLFTLTSGGNLGVGGDPDPDERLVVTGSANNSSTAIVVQNEYSLASSVNESTDLQFRFYNAGSTSFSSGAMIRSTKTEDWMTTATASASLNLFTRYNNTLARRIVISDIGKMIIGTQASPRANYGSTQSPQLQIEGTNSETGAIGVVRNSADSNPSYLYLGKTRSATNGVSAPAIVQDNDLIGSVVFTASDGAVLQNAARISGIVDGTPTAGTVPGELLFYVGDNGTDLAFRIEASSNATFAGDITTTGIQMGSGTANDIQANGKTAFFGSAIFGDSAATNTPLALVHIKGAGAPSLRIEDLDSTNQIYDFISNQGVGLSIVDLTASITPLAFAHTTGNATFAGDVTVSGDLFVTGASTSVNVEDLNVEQGEITLNFGAGDTSAAANGAGIRIQDAVDASTDATILWNATSDKFEFSHGIISAGPITGSNLSGTNTGDEPAASTTVAGIVELASITETNAGVSGTRAVTPAGLNGWTGSTNVTTLGTIATGTWNGTAIASAYLDTDTAHLSGTQTFTGNKTFSGGLGISDSSPAFIINDSDASNATNQVGYISFQRGSAEKAWIGYGSSGNPDFTIRNTEGAVTIDSNVDVTGTLTATSKSFDIEHPTKEGMRLRYGSLEGPENGVYVRGRMDGEQVIQLPDYWLGLVHEDTITVNLTSIGPGSVWVESIENNTITVGGSEKFFYHVFAERKDIEKLTVEYDV